MIGPLDDLLHIFAVDGMWGDKVSGITDTSTYAHILKDAIDKHSKEDQPRVILPDLDDDSKIQLLSSVQHVSGFAFPYEALIGKDHRNVADYVWAHHPFPNVKKNLSNIIEAATGSPISDQRSVKAHLECTKKGLYQMALAVIGIQNQVNTLYFSDNPIVGGQVFEG
ncbi:MAG: hypothetical protein ABIJ08_02790, partial [Nanoarchaeota archaeon]